MTLADKRDAMRDKSAALYPPSQHDAFVDGWNAAIAYVRAEIMTLRAKTDQEHAA